MESVDLKCTRQAQLVMLESLVRFDEICQRYDLKYWLDSGTLLGAVRHDGFIPWDDDIDISMPVEDYQKFLKIAQDELAEDMFLQTTRTDAAFPFDYAKIRNRKATIIELHEYGKNIKYHQGVFVDIFPMLSLRNTKPHILFYKSSFAAIRFFSAKHFQSNVVRSWFVRALNKLHRGWSLENTKVIYGGEMPDVAAYFDYKTVYPLRRINFENYSFLSPNNPHDYLKQIYSFNYMEIPAKEKRAVHAASIHINDQEKV